MLLNVPSVTAAGFPSFAQQARNIAQAWKELSDLCAPPHLLNLLLCSSSEPRTETAL